MTSSSFRWFHPIYLSDQNVLNLISSCPDTSNEAKIRTFLLTINVLVIVITYIDSYMETGMEKLFLYFTDYTLFLGTFSIYLTIKCSNSLAEGTEPKRYLGMHACSHLFYSFSILMNCVVMTVYWLVIHSGRV